MPTEITFINIGEDNNEVVVEVSVQNHGIAVNYTVFRDLLFGSMKEVKDVVLVMQTAIIAYEKLLEFIYNM